MSTDVIPLNLLKPGIATAGGKGASLGILAHRNIPVPDGFVILSTAYDRFLESAGIKKKLLKSLAGIDINKPQRMNAISSEVSGLIINAELPADLSTDILMALARLETTLVAVRSSAIAEDSSRASWAGEFESCINTPERMLLKNIKKCWASLFNPRAIHYSLHNGFSLCGPSMAVVVQKMIQSDSAGVCFTANPITKNRGQMLIDAGYGLGKAVVEGLITPDSYTIDKKEWRTVDKQISLQASMLINGAKGGTREKQVPKNRRDKQKLPDHQIAGLLKLCLEIEDIFGTPQDIEWACENQTFSILQSRPIVSMVE